MADNRPAWELASEKYLREFDDLLRQARDERELRPVELALLEPVLRTAPVVVHPQSGNGLDDIALVKAGAAHVTGVDFSAVAAGSAQRRADILELPCRYVVARLPGVPLRDGCADLVYTGKGALIWMPDIAGWAADLARLLRPDGTLFVFESHPAVPIWSWDPDEARVRPDRSYFGRTFVNDTFPANGAVEWQHTLGEIVTAVIGAGLTVRHLAEYPDPFWKPWGVEAAAWDGRLPNSFSLLATRS